MSFHSSLSRGARASAMAAVSLLAVFSFAAATTVRQPFAGITHIERTDWPEIPRAVTAHVLLIDLDSRSLRFRVTEPHQWKSPPDDDEAYTQPERTLDYLERVEAQVAINANFFVSGPNGLLDPLFLAVSNGTPYSKIAGAEPALAIDSHNRAKIVTSGSNPPTYQTSPSIDLYQAVGGNERIVFNGSNVANPGSGSGSYYGPRARTVAGLTQDEGTLVIIVVDEGRSQSQGVTPPESADMLIEYGVWQGINLDGGGSSTMAMADPDPRLINVPSDSSGPRAVATNLAIFAAPSPDDINDEEFSDIRISRGIDEAVISWETREPAAARVRFGDSLPPEHESILLRDPATIHHVLLTDLDFSTSYYYQLVAIRENGEQVRSHIRTMEPAGNVIVDNRDPEAAFSGSWNTGSFSGGWEVDYRFASTTAPTSVATYEPPILIPGRYTVSTWYVQGSNRAENTPFEITHADGTETVRVNQKNDGSQWRPLLENRPFAPGTALPTRISNDASGGDVVMADAVRWCLTSPDAVPPDEMPAWWADHFFGNPNVAPDADHNGDGKSAQEGYILGIDPAGHRPALDVRLTQNSGDGGLTLEIFPVYSDREYTVEVSANLVDWEPASGVEWSRLETGEAQAVLPPPSAAREFYRLRVTRP